MRLLWCWLAAIFAIVHATAAEPPPVDAAPALHADYKVGPWIWAASTSDKQTCRFWRAFEVPSDRRLVNAHLRLTADNSYRLFLDGRELGRGTEWRSLTDYDLTWTLKPGTHVIAVETFNDYLQGGLTAGLRLEFEEGNAIDIPSDPRWKLVPDDESGWMTRRTPRPHWTAAHVVAPYLGGVWKSPPARIIREAPVRPLPEKFWQTGWFQIGLITVCVVVGLCCIYLLSRLALQATAQEVLQRERARIARDIHDDFGARLTKLVLFGELAQNEIGGGSPLRTRFEQISSEGRNLLGALDEVVWTVNSRRDTVRDFEAYVCNYAETFLRPTALRLRIDADSDFPEATFDLAIRRNLFLGVKEALNNAVRHAAAQEIRLGLHLRDDDFVVTVEDDGRGFDTAKTGGERNGLANMAQRTAETGGSCRVVSAPGTGCRIEFIVPLRHRRRSFWRRWPRVR